MIAPTGWDRKTSITPEWNLIPYRRYSTFSREMSGTLVTCPAQPGSP
jgi:hypothetical protein